MHQSRELADELIEVYFDWRERGAYALVIAAAVLHFVVIAGWVIRRRVARQ